MPQVAGQVKNLIFLVKIKFFPMYANIFCDEGQVPILRYFEACSATYLLDLSSHQPQFGFTFYSHADLSLYSLYI